MISESRERAYNRCMFALVLPVIAAFFVTVVVAFFLRPLARNLDFVDRPGGRKLHSDEIPVVGGLAMFLGLSVGLSVLPEDVRPPLTFQFLAFLFVLTGLLDDRFSLSPWVRLAIQAIAVFVMVFLSGLAVVFVGEPFGSGKVIFASLASVVMTVVLVVGAVNAFNMVDGIDGLAGSLGLVALVGVGLAALGAPAVPVLGIALALGGAVVGFLLFNWPLGFNRHLRIFMGDAGSMLIGFVLAWSFVALSQNPDTVWAPVTLLWFVAIPIFDLVSTALGRIRRGVSPFSADTSHFHHALILRGLSRPLALVTLLVLSVGWAVVGVMLEHWGQVPEWASLLGFLVAGGVTNRLIRRVGSQASVPTPIAPP